MKPVENRLESIDERKMLPWQRLLRRKPIACRVVLALLVGLSVTFTFWKTMRDGPDTARSVGSSPTSEEGLPAAVLVAMRKFKEHASPRSSLSPLTTPAFGRKKGRKGLLNVHYWDELCGDNLANLRNFPLFPTMPTKRKLLTLPIQRLGEHYGVRIFGYFAPPATRAYELMVMSSGNAELWLSSSADPRYSKLVCRTGGQRIDQVYHSPVTTVHLEQNKTYYVEALHKHAVGGNGIVDFFAVRWKTSVDKPGFKDIPMRFFHSFQDDARLLDYDVSFDYFPRARLPMHARDRLPTRENTDYRIQSFNLPFFEDELGEVLFDKRPYTPSYTIKDEKLRRYGAVWETHYTAVFPTNMTDNMVSHTGFISLGNDALEEASAKRVVEMVSTQLKNKYKG